MARALAKMSMEAKDCCAEVGDLTQEQLKTLEDWEAKLKAKYPCVGKVCVFVCCCMHRHCVVCCLLLHALRLCSFICMRATQVVEPKRLTLEQLRAYNGEDKSKPIYLAIRGVVFDVTRGEAVCMHAAVAHHARGCSRELMKLSNTGAEFYGPDGIYPFAGHECARAFALISTEVADCNANLEVKGIGLLHSQHAQGCACALKAPSAIVQGLGGMELDNLRDWEAKFHYKYPVVGSLV